MAVADSAAASIKALILEGQLKPGDRLPAERVLSAQLGVSRSSLREAVAALTEMGVLEARLGDGTYLTALEPTQLFEGLGFAIDLLRGAYLPHVLAVRRSLESFATGLAASLITDEQLAELTELQTNILREGLPIEQRIGADLAFHARICEISGNEVLAGLLDVIRGTARQASQWRGTDDPDGLDRIRIEHQLILDALRVRDGGLAATVAASHIAGLEHWATERSSGGTNPSWT